MSGWVSGSVGEGTARGGVVMAAAAGGGSGGGGGTGSSGEEKRSERKEISQQDKKEKKKKEGTKKFLTPRGLWDQTLGSRRRQQTAAADGRQQVLRSNLGLTDSHTRRHADTLG